MAKADIRSFFLCGRLINGKLHFQDSPAIHSQHFKFVSMIENLLMECRKFSLYLEQQSGQCIGISIYFVKIIFVDLRNLIKSVNCVLASNTQV